MVVKFILVVCTVGAVCAIRGAGVRAADVSAVTGTGGRTLGTGFSLPGAARP